MTWETALALAKRIVESDATVGAAFGGFFGALGAQVAISRYQTKQTALAELNSVRAALLVCFSISSKFMALKRQQVRPLVQRYARARQELEAAIKADAQRVGAPAVHRVEFDLQTLAQVKVPIEMLERYVPEKISIGGRGLAAALDLIGAVDSVEKAIAYRDGLIADAQQNGITPERYFGLTTAAGLTDEKFSSNITALGLYTDDCIFFARQLSDDLLEYGNNLRRRYHRRLYRLNIRKFRPADWTIAQREGLIPPPDDYKDWLRGFKPTPPPLTRLWRWLRPKPQT